MREIQLQGTAYNWSVRYPESTVWLNDNNVIRIDGQYSGTGAEIDITRNTDGATRTLRHMGQLSYIVFSLDDTLLNLYQNGNMSYSVSIRIYHETVLDAEMAFPVTILNGKTYPNRSHGSDRTIYTYDQEMLRKIQLWSESTGELSVLGYQFNIHQGYNAINLNGLIDRDGTYSMCFTTGSFSPSAQIDSVMPITPIGATINLSFTAYTPEVRREPLNSKGGDIWDDTKYDTDNWCIDLVYKEPCYDNNTMVFRYLNADGLVRYIAGKIVEEDIKNSRGTYFRIEDDTNIRNYPRSIITASQKNVKVCFDDIAKTAYLMDICSSPIIEYLNYEGEWKLCDCITNTLRVGSSDSQDYEIEFCLNRE